MQKPTAEQTKLLLQELLDLETYNINRLNKIKRRFANERKIGMVRNADILQIYRELVKKQEVTPNKHLERLLKKRSIRTLSGVAPITLMTAPLGCPKNCLYCPTEKNMPKSYLSNQPAAMRAVLSDFDPVTQTETRLRALKKNGHSTDKIEIIINGGTWSAHPHSYQTWYITKIFETCNSFDEASIKEHSYLDFKKAAGVIKQKLTKRAKIDKKLYQPDDTELREALFRAQKINETAKNRIIGITLETRPDHITPAEVKRMRMLGATKVEIGVQTLYQDVSELNRRDQTVQIVSRATKLLKDAGFKVAYHMMPGMYGSSPQRDIDMFKELFANPRYKPDFLKIYPCVVVKDSDLYQKYLDGEFKPYDTETLVDTIVKIKQHIPVYCRIARLHRDIPTDSIAGGCKTTNLRQYITQELDNRQLACRCIRCREPMKAKANRADAKFNQLQFTAASSQEYFLTFDSADHRYLYAFLRLRLPTDTDNEVTEIMPTLQNAAIVRELHTYGVLTPLDNQGREKAVQHLGFGKKLMAEAEKIARQNGADKIAVISGVGVRKYYEKLGYKLQDSYMVKNLA